MKREQEIIDLLRSAGTTGMTWKEIAEHLDIHHGQASGCLSKLHREGTIKCLNEYRLRCRVYVLPGHVSSRQTIPYRRARTTRDSTPVTQEWEVVSRVNGNLVLKRSDGSKWVAKPL